MDNYIKFTEKDHSYKDPNGIPYTSVTRLIGSFSNEFNAELISGMVANKRKRVVKEMAEAQGVTEKEVIESFEEGKRGITVEEVLAEWDKTRDDANAHGNRIHNAFEDYDKGKGITDLELQDVILSVENDLPRYKKVEAEPILYCKDNFVSGMSDKLCYRTKTRVDWYDYKTNEIKFDSSSVDQYTGELKWNNKFMKAPLDHLEDCNFNKYALQLSTYAWLGEKTFGLKPGRLAIINIDKELNYKFIPVPYMKAEVEAMMKHNSKNNVLQMALQSASEDGSF